MTEQAPPKQTGEATGREPNSEAAEHPVDRVYGIVTLDRPVDELMIDMRGRPPKRQRKGD